LTMIIRWCMGVTQSRTMGRSREPWDKGDKTDDQDQKGKSR
jgi:hypothetical protein